MGSSEKPTIVERVDFSQVLAFPRILRAITMSFAPGRLVLGLLMVVAILTAGRAWDWAATPNVHPKGLMVGKWTEQHQALAQPTLRIALQRYVEEEAWPEGEPADWDLQAGEVLIQVRDGYQAKRAAVEDDEIPPPLAEDRYRSTIKIIEASQPLGIFEATTNHVIARFDEMMYSIVFLDPTQLMFAASELFLFTPSALWSDYKFFTITMAIVLVIVLGIGGGTLSRLCACEIATGDKLRLNDGVDFAISSWRPLIFSLVLPLLIAIVLCLFLMVGGLILSLPFLDVIGGLLYPIALLLGFGITFLLIGYAFGFSLLIPAVACENCDAADAQQRAYHYFLTKPLHLIGYGFVGLVGLAVGFIIASNVGQVLLDITTAAVGMWSENPAFTASHSAGEVITLSWHIEFASSLVSFWSAIVGYLVAGYVFANFYSASTIVYMLMRRACDKQELTEVWQQGHIPNSAVPNPLERDEVL